MFQVPKGRYYPHQCCN